MFVYNNWYIAALDSEVTADKPLARYICGKPVVLFRNDKGVASALEDRCIHRGMPLSKGTVCDNGRAIVCPYHGLEFDSTGACVRAPSQTSLPKALRVQTYPVVERYKFIWIWTGEAERANPDEIPVIPFVDDPAFDQFNHARIEYKADWQLIYDNVMDLTHLAFVHVGYVNGDTEANATSRLKVETDQDRNRIWFKRETPNCEPPPQYKLGFAFKGRIDRWQDMECSPSGMYIWSGGLDVGEGAFEGRREGGLQLGTYHGITPSTDGHCHYFAIGARNVHHGNEAVAAQMRKGMMTTLDEDRAVIEVQQERLNDTAGRPVVSLAADAAGLQVRRMFKRLKSAEAEKFPPRPVAHVDLMDQLGGV